MLRRRWWAVAVATCLHWFFVVMVGFSSACVSSPLAPHPGVLLVEGLIPTGVFVAMVQRDRRTLAVAGAALVVGAPGVAVVGLAGECVAAWTVFWAPLVAVMFGRSRQPGEIIVRLCTAGLLLSAFLLIEYWDFLFPPVWFLYPFVGMEIASAWRQAVISRRSDEPASTEVSSGSPEDE